jgi:hypothetical protein
MEEKAATSSDEEITEKTRSAHMEIGFNKRIMYHGDVLRRVRWILIRGPLIAEHSHVGVVVESEPSFPKVGQCTNPWGIHVNPNLLILDRTHTVVRHWLVRSDL